MANSSALTTSADRSVLRAARVERFRLDHVPDEALHLDVKTLTGRHNALTADLLAHLAEVDARGIYRERACSSLYTYCVYELRLSEDEAQRRAKAARTAREFPLLFEMLAEGAIHLTGLLLLAPYLTAENHAELLARARFRTKREIERLVAEIAPRPEVVARIEPLGPRSAPANLWQAYTASLRGPVRKLSSGAGAGHAPPAGNEPATGAGPTPPADLESRATARVAAPAFDSKPLAPLRYRVEFTASQEYVELLEEARNLLQHTIPDRDIARVHELVMVTFVEHLKRRRQAATRRPRPVATDGPAPARVAEKSDGPAPARVAPRRNRTAAGDDGALRDEPDAASRRYVPAEIRRAVWRRDAGRCTFADESGRRCRERAGLELHHEHAFALGGPTTLENLRLMCRAHNGLHAERDFGRAHVERAKRRREHNERLARRREPSKLRV